MICCSSAPRWGGSFFLPSLGCLTWDMRILLCLACQDLLCDFVHLLQVHTGIYAHIPIHSHTHSYTCTHSHRKPSSSWWDHCRKAETGRGSESSPAWLPPESQMTFPGWSVLKWISIPCFWPSTSFCQCEDDNGQVPPLAELKVQWRVTIWSPTEGHSLEEGYNMGLNRVLWAHGLWLRPFREEQWTCGILPNKVARRLEKCTYHLEGWSGQVAPCGIEPGTGGEREAVWGLMENMSMPCQFAFVWRVREWVLEHVWREKW